MEAPGSLCWLELLGEGEKVAGRVGESVKTHSERAGTAGNWREQRAWRCENRNIYAEISWLGGCRGCVWA